MPIDLDVPTTLEPRAPRKLDADRLEDPLRTLRHREPVRVAPGTPVAAALRAMREARLGSCLVEDSAGRLLGIVTERDLLNKLPLEGADLGRLPVDQLMQAEPETLTPDHPIAYALNRMVVGGYRHVPLVDAAHRAVGLVTLRDIVEEVCEHFSEEVLCLPPTRRCAIASEREGA